MTLSDDNNNFPDMDRDRLEEFLWWMCERQRIWQRRFVQEDPPPWTDDEVLQDYHFCNVHRRLDRGTKYLLEEILGQGSDEDVFFNIILYRFLNRIPTYRALGGFTPVDEFDVDETVRTLKVYGQTNPIFSSAYRVTTHKWADSESKAENILYGIVRDDLLQNFEEYIRRILGAESMEEAFNSLQDIRGVGDFLAYEIVTDLNYGLLPFSENDFVNIGPGAEMGLALIFGDAKKDDLYWLQQNYEWLFAYFDLDFPYWEEKPELTLRDFEHSLCEYNKYVGVKYRGEGRRRFKPHDYAQDQLSDFD